MEATRSQLLQVREAATDRDKMDPGIARAIIESAHIAIEKNMLEAIPSPGEAHRQTRAPCYWHVCLRMLHDTGRRLNRPIALPALLKLSGPLTKYGEKLSTVLLHYPTAVHIENLPVPCQYHFHTSSIPLRQYGLQT